MSCAMVCDCHRIVIIIVIISIYTTLVVATAWHSILPNEGSMPQITPKCLISYPPVM